MKRGQKRRLTLLGVSATVTWSASAPSLLQQARVKLQPALQVVIRSTLHHPCLDQLLYLRVAEMQLAQYFDGMLSKARRWQVDG
jgi:hypothetical protein